MKKIFWILVGCAAFQGSRAQVAPKWAEKAKKAVFSIVTYDKDNNIKNTGNGFYIDEDGTALSDYTLFEGAERAVIINADSRELPVTFILGANSMYDVVKFSTATDKKAVALVAANRPAAVGETVYLLPYSTQKAASCQTGEVTRVDTIGTNAYYYTLAMSTGEKTVSCPVMNGDGEVLGLIQKNVADDAKESYAIGVTYGASLNINALSVNDLTLNRIGIRKALPGTEEQALIYLYMASTQLDNESYIAALGDFLAQYPNNADGYVRRATAYMGYGDETHNAQADADLKRAAEVTSNRGDTQYNIAKLIYNYMLALGDGTPYSDWNYDKALESIRIAIQEDNQPVYVQLEGDILFAMQRYEEAYTAYEQVNKSDIVSAATFYSAAKAKQLSEGADMNEVVALLDSAVVRFTKPYSSEEAPYFYERAEAQAQLGKYREAVADYNEFYDAVGGRVTASFYLQREQAEVQCKMYQQAIDDIGKAVEMAPEDVEMWVEKGSIHLRVSQYDEAIKALEKAISLDPKEPTAYRILGYCQVQIKKNAEACANLAKALELGDEVAGSLIEKYCK